jgi:phosphate transport system substrate-binding protein
MLNKRHNPVITLAILLSILGTGAIKTSEISAVAQSKPQSQSFTLPKTVPNGTQIKIAGSPSTEGIDRTFKEKFEAQFPGTIVNTEQQNSDSALATLAKGQVDLALIGRPLTNAEKAQGLVALPISREKIAIVVGKDNNFQQNLTIEQFAKIFRGEITDWSELGGDSGSISLIDLSETNDTRRAFANYPVFKVKNFATGSNAIPLEKDDLDTAISKLGKNGIGYAVAGDVIGRDDVRPLLMHQTKPTESKYPFSQPFLFVYKNNPSDAAKAFLGFVTSDLGKQIITARQTATPIALSTGSVATNPVNAANSTSGNDIASSGNTASNPTTEEAATNLSQSGGADSNNPNGTETSIGADTNPSDSSTNGEAKTKRGFPWWIIPLIVLIPLLGWFLLGRRSNSDNTAEIASDSLNSVSSARVEPNLEDIIPPVDIDNDRRSTDILERRNEVEIDNNLDLSTGNDGIVKNMRESAQQLTEPTNNLGEGIVNAGNAALAGEAALAGGAAAAASSLFGNRTEQAESIRDEDLDLNLEDSQLSQFELESSNIDDYDLTEDLSTLDTDLEFDLDDEIVINESISSLEEIDSVDTNLEFDLETLEGIEGLDVDLEDFDLETLEDSTTIENLEGSNNFDDRFEADLESLDLEDPDSHSINELFNDAPDEELNTSNNISEWLDNLETSDNTSDNITEWLNNLERKNGSFTEDRSTQLNLESDTNNDLSDFFDDSNEDLSESTGDVNDDSFKFLEDLLEQTSDFKKDDR